MELEVGSFGLGVSSIPHVERLDLPFIHTADQAQLEQYRDFSHVEHIVIIGQGGSVNSIRFVAHALAPHTQVHILDTQDPYRLRTLKEQVKHSCLVVPISKSGNTLSVLQNMLYFADLPLLCITDESGALYGVAKTLGAPIVPHPPVGGRFIGNTLACLLPAFLAGVDTASVIAGAKKAYGQSKINALRVAQLLHKAEREGYGTVYAPLYDYRLGGAKELFMQLLHETAGKNGAGQTILCVDGPECQHHTNQRYFGGPRDTVGCFFSVRQYEGESSVYVPPAVSSVTIGEKPLSLLQGVAHQTALHAELDGVLAHAQHEQMPYVHICVEKMDAYHVGYLMAFWQLVSVFSAQLRGANPFDQPEVEYAKDATRDLLL